MARRSAGEAAAARRRALGVFGTIEPSTSIGVRLFLDRRPKSSSGTPWTNLQRIGGGAPGKRSD